MELSGRSTFYTRPKKTSQQHSVIHTVNRINNRRAGMKPALTGLINTSCIYKNLSAPSGFSLSPKQKRPRHSLRNNEAHQYRISAFGFLRYF